MAEWRETKETKEKQTAGGWLSLPSAFCTSMRKDLSWDSKYPRKKQDALVHSRHVCQPVSSDRFSQKLRWKMVDSRTHMHMYWQLVHIQDNKSTWIAHMSKCRHTKKTELSNRHPSWNRINKLGAGWILFSLLSSSTCLSILPSFPSFSVLQIEPRAPLLLHTRHISQPLRILIHLETGWQGTVSLYFLSSLGWLQTCCPPASAFSVLPLQVCVTTLGS